MLSDFFPGLNDSEFCSLQADQTWMSDIIDGIEGPNFLGDDLLTDTISECLKTKPETICYDTIPTDSTYDEILVGDEVEINDTCVLPATSDESSGYTSCVPSSGTSSPVNFSQPSESELRPFRVTALSTPSVSKNQDITHLSSTTKLPHSVHNIFSNATGSTNRIQFILRPGTRVTPANRHMVSSTDIPFRSANGRPNPETPGYGVDSNFFGNDEFRSPINTPASSQSSSESDAKENFDDECVYSDVISENENFLDSKRTANGNRAEGHQLKCSPMLGIMDSVSRNSSRQYLQDLCSVTYDGGSIVDYSFSKVSSQSLYQCQMSSRNRVPARLNRTEMDHSSMLVLTDEEKRTLIAEGYPIPTRLPLSKQDERNLKKVRRKIKNKISAQESRRKKKEYLEALERKVNVYSQENVDLKRRVDGLESTNRSLLGQLRLLQQLLNKSKSGDHQKHSVRNNSHGNSGVINSNNGSCYSATVSHKSSPVTTSISNSNGSASTCLMVFALCFAALLIGQPVYPENSMPMADIGLSYSSKSDNFFDKLISQGPRRLVSGSFAQLGYSLSKSPPPNSLQSIDSMNLLSTHVHSGQLMGPSIIDNFSNLTGHQSQLNRNLSENENGAPYLRSYDKTIKQKPRSRLLGSPSEMEDCAPVQTFWSYLFGSGNTNHGPIHLSSSIEKCEQTDQSRHLFDTIEMEVMLLNAMDGHELTNETKLLGTYLMVDPVIDFSQNNHSFNIHLRHTMEAY